MGHAYKSRVMLSYCLKIVQRLGIDITGTIPMKYIAYCLYELFEHMLIVISSSTFNTTLWFTFFSVFLHSLLLPWICKT